MNTGTAINKTIASLIVAGAIALTSLPAGVVHAGQGQQPPVLSRDNGAQPACCSGSVDAADYIIWRDASRTQVGVGDLQEVTISKSMDW